MSSRQPPSPPLTPKGRLAEGGLRELLGYQLAQAAIATDELFDRAAAGPLELRRVEFTILQLLKENEGVTPSRLASALALTAPAVTTWLDRLEARGLVQRVRSSADGRAQIVSTSRAGAALASRALRSLLDAERAALAGLSEGERLLMLELLHKVAAARPR